MKKFKVALQLYSIRNDMRENMEEALKTVKEIGYDYVEFAGFFDKTAEEVKGLLDKYGLKAVSVHQNVDVFLKQGSACIDYLKKIGVEYCAIPWYDAGRLKGTTGWEETVKNFTSYGEALKESGIQMLYHNHDFEFRTFENKPLIDWIYETIPSDILHPQFDTCWVTYAGYDACEYIEKYSGKVEVVHLKDFESDGLLGGPVYDLIGDSSGASKAKTKEENKFMFKPVGYGRQDFEAILSAAEKAGTEYVIVEQDEHPERSATEDAKLSREYLKTLGV